MTPTRRGARTALATMVGAVLVIGGASVASAAGLWQDTAPVGGVTVRSGTIAASVVAGTAAGQLAPGTTLRIPLTVTNTGTVAEGAVDLNMVLTSVTATGDGDLRGAVRVRAIAGTCPASPAVPTTTTAQVGGLVLGPTATPGTQRAACLILGLAPGAPSTLQNRAIALVVTVNGAQA